MNKLILFSDKELINELMSRKHNLVIAYTDEDDNKEDSIHSQWSYCNSWVNTVGLVNILKLNIESSYLENQEEKE